MPEILPLADAVARISAKTPIGSILKSREWEEVPLALRERAQFSAAVTSVKLLQGIQDRIAGQVGMQREQLANGKVATFDRSSFIDAMRKLARDEGLTPVDPALRGGLQDITSIPRLGLIYDMQNSMASGYAQWKLDQNEGALALWPAQRLSESTAKNPRQDWPARWARAGAAVGWQGARQSGFVALKSSPIWAALSRFGTPWPPFDWGSTRELEDVDREEAIALGLIGPDEVPSGGEESFNAKLEASVTGVSPDLREVLERYFDTQIEVVEGVARWSGKTADPARIESAGATEVVSGFAGQFAKEEMRLSKLTHGHEEGKVYRPDGSVLFDLIPIGKNELGLRPKDFAQLKQSPNTVIVHSHPYGFSFSLADFKSAIEHNLAGVVAVGTKASYTYYLRRPSAGWPAMSKVELAFNRINDELKKTNGAEAFLERSHRLARALASEFGMSYERVKRA